MLYTEYVPTDVSTQFQDGSFTYANGVINLTRFALPDFKLFVILRCDMPMGNDFTGIKRVFFNGEGIWLEGPLSKPEWFPPEIRKLITKTHKILRKHRDAFTSMAPVPLVPTRRPEILANKFSCKDKIVWTLHNFSNETVLGELLEIKHLSGATYYDAWNDCKLKPVIIGDRALIQLEIRALDIGCIVQYSEGLCD